MLDKEDAILLGGGNSLSLTRPNHSLMAKE